MKEVVVIQTVIKCCLEKSELKNSMFYPPDKGDRRQESQREWTGGFAGAEGGKGVTPKDLPQAKFSLAAVGQTLTTSLF